MGLMSMTGFGAGRASTESMVVSCEIKSVNSRYIDVSVRAPRQWGFFESQVINILKSRFHRGKFDVVLEVQQGSLDGHHVPFDEGVVAFYAEKWLSLREKYPEVLSQQIRLADLVKLGALKQAASRPVDRDNQVSEVLEEALLGGCDSLERARAAEGSALQAAIEVLLDRLNQQLSEAIELRSKLTRSLVAAYQTRLRGLIDSFAPDQADPIRLAEKVATDIASYADRLDVEEELVRLGHHVGAVRQQINLAESGRKLDFLCQEMHREVSTFGVKLQHHEASRVAVSMKQLIERIRQQVQNVE